MPFSAFHLSPPILKAIHELGYTKPTEIQAQALPLIMSGKDIMGHSETGSGKTAAFGLPIISHIKQGNGVQALILTPTRELCVQVSDALRGFSKYIHLRIVPVSGGVGLGPQIRDTRSADIIVATPGRLLDLMQRGLRLHTVRYLVLDEADRMLDMGFIHDVERILKQIPRQRQTLLFSATLSPKLRGLVQRYMNNPVAVQAKTHVDTSLLKERAYNVPFADKLSLLVHLLKHQTSGIAIVFAKTRHGCDKLAKKLRAQKIEATAIHGGLAQNKRTNAINALHHHGSGILVATDVASRGLHINNISHVYNYDLPQAPDDYVHRIGRTARAGASGEAITFVTPEAARDFRGIAQSLHRPIRVEPLPAFEKIIEPKVAHTKEFYGKKKQFWRRRRN
ncbi:MAG TPA: DEAD/DEAH box helicase [Candidatus Binatia bacterium]|nr:DEAD/DEAH box helicase [Candidatus Binatia bacterium]